MTNDAERLENTRRWMNSLRDKNPEIDAEHLWFQVTLVDLEWLVGLAEKAISEEETETIYFFPPKKTYPVNMHIEQQGRGIPLIYFDGEEVDFTGIDVADSVLTDEEE